MKWEGLHLKVSKICIDRWAHFINTQVEPSQLEIYSQLGLSGTPLERRLAKQQIGSEKRKRQVSLL